ncbi:MAG: ribonuclease HII, partial [Campylobacter concisus]|nr:ribonuclease HII [Campylobacter concisus]
IYDGNLDYGVGIMTMIKADGKVAGVSAASILAKVSRDRLMNGWDKFYPAYGFAGHKGYGTKSHLDAIAKFGYSDFHRKSFVIKPKLAQSSLF